MNGKRYITGIFILNALATLFTAPVQAEKIKWYQAQGKGYPVCDAVYNKFKRYNLKKLALPNRQLCSWFILNEFDKLSQPAWGEERSTSEIKELVLDKVNIYYYKPYGEYEPGSPLPPFWARASKSDTEYALSPQGNPSYRIWQVMMPDWLNHGFLAGGYANTPLRLLMTGREPLMQRKRIRESINDCLHQHFIKKKPEKIWGGVYLANESLTGTDPRTRSSSTTHIRDYYGPGMLRDLMGTTPYIFEGKTYFFSISSNGDEIIIISFAKRELLLPFCVIRNH
nr:hypothetical protein [uncultured Enterobacter sp.]